MCSSACGEGGIIDSGTAAAAPIHAATFFFYVVVVVIVAGAHKAVPSPCGGQPLRW
jgi:hypothetical protein